MNGNTYRLVQRDGTWKVLIHFAWGHERDTYYDHENLLARIANGEQYGFNMTLEKQALRELDLKLKRKKK